MGCELRFACQEWQERVRPLLARPPRDLGHPLEGPEKGLCVVRLPHLLGQLREHLVLCLLELALPLSHLGQVPNTPPIPPPAGQTSHIHPTATLIFII